MIQEDGVRTGKHWKQVHVKSVIENVLKSLFNDEIGVAEARAVINGFYFVLKGTKNLLSFLEDGDLNEVVCQDRRNL